MAIQNRTILYTQFQNNDVPTETGFQNLIDSAANLADTSTQSFAGQLAPTGIVGTTTNNDAAAGSVGEYIFSEVTAANAVPLTNNIAANVTFIALTPGDWDVWGNTAYVVSATTNITAIINGLSDISATLPTRPGSGGALRWIGSQTGSVPDLTAGRRRFSVATSANVYLTAVAGFTISTLSAIGFIGARRVR